MIWGGELIGEKKNPLRKGNMVLDKSPCKPSSVYCFAVAYISEAVLFCS
jgi:hypothetical protein